MENYVVSPAQKPVVAEFESIEVVYAKDQPEYLPLHVLRGNNKGAVLSRWTFTDEQRQAIADGADIFLDVLTFNQPLQPLAIYVAHELEASSVAEMLGIVVPLPSDADKV